MPAVRRKSKAATTLALTLGATLLLVLLTGAGMITAASIRGQSWRLGIAGHGVKLNAYPHHGAHEYHGRRIGCYPGWEGCIGPVAFLLTYW